MECAQIQITGGGSTVPATVSFPGAYKGVYTHSIKLCYSFLTHRRQELTQVFNSPLKGFQI